MNLAAQWGDDFFVAGGDVTGKGAEHAHAVHFEFANQTSAEDVIAGSVALLALEGGVAFPARVEIMDRAGSVISSYDEFEFLA